MEKPKNKSGTSSVSFKLRKALACQKGQVHKHFPKQLKEMKIKLMGQIPQEYDGKKDNIMDVVSATAEHLLGESQQFVEKKYHLARNAIDEALRMFFPSREAREKALMDLFLDNALIGATIYREKSAELTPMQAAITSGIFADKYINIRKASSNNFQQEVPVNLVLQLEQTLAKANAKVIDI